MYLTWEEYLIKGGTMDSANYYTAEYEAERLIDYYTFNRLAKETEIPEAVKFCTYKLIQSQVARDGLVAQSINVSDNSAAISSQSNDGVSISYNKLSASEVLQMYKNDDIATIRRYLSGVTNSLGQELLYRGVYPNER